MGPRLRCFRALLPFMSCEINQKVWHKLQRNQRIIVISDAYACGQGVRS